MALFFGSITGVKKIFTTILFVAYLIASSGATIRVHYCGGKAVQWDLGKSKSNDDKCPGCGMKDKKGCCNDKETTIKISNSYQQSITNFQIAAPRVHLNYFLIKEDDSPSILLSKPQQLSLSFPFRPTSLLYITHCVFLI